MKKLLVAAFLIATGPAIAADIVQPTYKAPPPPLAAADLWSGPYVGGNIGYGFGTTDPELNVGVNVPSAKPSGVFAGGQVGYRWSVGVPGWYLGLESLFDWSGMSDTIHPFGISAKASPQWFGYTAGTVSYAFNQAMLAYGKAGVAYASNKLELSGGGTSLSDTERGVGYALGGGVEVSLASLGWRNWSARLDYTYMNFGKSNFGFDLGGGPTLGFKTQTDVNAVMLGMNYQFATK